PRYFAKVLEESFLGGLIVIGSDLQGAVRAHFLRILSKVNGLARSIAACPRQYFDAPRREPDGQCNDVDVLFVTDRGRFPRGADGNNPIYAAFDLRLNQFFERRLIDFSLLERRDNRRVSPGEHGQILIVPSNTKSAGPLKRTSVKLPPFAS